MGTKIRPGGQIMPFVKAVSIVSIGECSEIAQRSAGTVHEPVVYYMRMDRLVKIGWTINIRTRVESLGPQGVLAIEFGGRDQERIRHKQFMDHHSHLEWFWLRDALPAHIVELRETFEQETGHTTEAWLASHGVRSTAIGAAP